MEPPRLRTAVEGAYKAGSPQWYYARRVRARSQRKPLQFNTPAAVGLQRRPRDEDNLSMRLDVLGPLLREHYPVVPDVSRANLLAAFDKRCNYYSDARVDKEVVMASLRLLERIAVGGQAPIEWTPELFHRWNAQFKSDKQARHLAVLPRIAECTVREFSEKAIFVKVEALLKRSDPDWAPRVIYQSSDLHNCLLGPVMQECTKRMFSLLKLVDSQSDVNYRGAYRVQAQENADFISRYSTESSVFLESDFSANDMTQLRDVHLLEVQWLRALGAPLWLTGLMLHANSFVVSNKRFGLRGKVTNQLPTGAQSTTFRNSFWNMSISYCFCLRHGFIGDCLVLGDDNLLRIDNPWECRARALRRAYEDVCKRAGMRAVVSVCRHLCECSFLSKHFIMTNSGYVMVPKYGKAMARFNARASANEAVSDSAYLCGKALSYAYEFRSCPPLSRCFLERFRQLWQGECSLDGVGWNARGAFLDLGVKGVLSACLDVDHTCTRDDMTRFYHWKYGMTATDVIAFAIAVLFGEDDLDEVAAGRIVEDFV